MIFLINSNFISVADLGGAGGDRPPSRKIFRFFPAKTNEK